MAKYFSKFISYSLDDVLEVNISLIPLFSSNNYFRKLIHLLFSYLLFLFLLL